MILRMNHNALLQSHMFYLDVVKANCSGHGCNGYQGNYVPHYTPGAVRATHETLSPVSQKKQGDQVS